MLKLSLLFSSRISESSIKSLGVFDFLDTLSLLLSSEIGEPSSDSTLIGSFSNYETSIFYLKVGDEDSMSKNGTFDISLSLFSIELDNGITLGPTGWGVESFKIGIS